MHEKTYPHCYCQKPFRCELCLCSYSESNERHIRTLTAMKLFRCVLCVFIKYATYPHSYYDEALQMGVVCVHIVRVFPTKRHTPIHLGAKPFKCELCKLKYSHLECVKVHNA